MREVNPLMNDTMALILLLAGGGWALSHFLSAYLHPYKPCRSCKGSGIAKGSVFTFSHRACASCGGKSRYRRVGAPAAGKAFGEGRKR